MANDRKQKLIDLGADALADALIDLAVHSDKANDLIERMIATPEENIQRFKKKLSGLKHSERFIDWRGAADFAHELEMLLQDVKAGVNDPFTGVELVVAFYEADNTIFDMCDDSSGNIGDIFHYNAKELFVDYASRCNDKDKIADIISLARQIKDAQLFEKTRIASCEKLSTAAFVDIARVYLESGDVETAHSWLKKIPEGEIYQAYDRDKLLEEIYHKQGDSEKLAELLYQKFRSYHSTDTLQTLLDVIGHDKRDEVISDEVEQILKNHKLRESDAAFLIAIGKIDEAEAYLLKRTDQLDGNHYGSLLSLAETMESENRHLTASLIFRSLLISILERGYTKAYPHGIRYLKKLDTLSASINNWKNFNNHEAFKAQIIQAHGRKRSFWSNYEVKK